MIGQGIVLQRSGKRFLNGNLVAKNKSTVKGRSKEDGLRYEACKLEGLFPVLDGVAWMDAPSIAALAQFTGSDPRTVGKILKNALQIGLVDKVGHGYVLLTSYPFKGTPEQKRDVVRAALVTMPLLTSMRQFLSLGENEAHALRKAATLGGVGGFSPANYAPLLDWARDLGALEAGLVQEDLLDDATASKASRHVANQESRVAFLSHSSADKPLIRQLAADLTAAGVTVWLDEQRIKVGESIPEKISQGLAESDYFLLAVSARSVESEWVKRELNGALVNEVERRAVHVLPLKLDATAMPAAVSDKKYADFSASYKAGLQELLTALKGDLDV